MKFLKTIVVFFASGTILLGGCSTSSVETNTSSTESVDSSLPEIVAERPKSAADVSPSDDVSSEIPVSSAPKVSATQENVDALSGESITWGPGNNKNADGRPTTPVQLQEQYGPLGAYFITPADGPLYLTFDEGYENGFTPSILDTLKAKNVHAVFFVTMPFAKENPELIQRMINEGHVLGNHSVNHKDMTTLDTATATEEIMGLHNYIKETYGYEMWLFRPPTGTFSEKSLAIAHNAGYISVFWSFAYRDWLTDNQMAPADALDRLSNNLYGGALYLLHAVSSTNASILGDFIDLAEQQGFTFGDFSALPDPYVE